MIWNETIECASESDSDFDLVIFGDEDFQPHNFWSLFLDVLTQTPPWVFVLLSILIYIICMDGKLY